LSSVHNPPYAVEATAFRFAGLASLAGRSALGGQREVALATYLAARLAEDTLPDHGVSPAVRLERAAHAKVWLATLALPANVRGALTKLVEASSGEPAAAARATADVARTAASFLDVRAQSELEHLVSALDAGSSGHSAHR
jgi:hypothetical protein